MHWLENSGTLRGYVNLMQKRMLSNWTISWRISENGSVQRWFMPFRLWAVKNECTNDEPQLSTWLINPENALLLKMAHAQLGILVSTCSFRSQGSELGVEFEIGLSELPLEYLAQDIFGQRRHQFDSSCQLFVGRDALCGRWRHILREEGKLFSFVLPSYH